MKEDTADNFPWLSITQAKKREKKKSPVQESKKDSC